MIDENVMIAVSNLAAKIKKLVSDHAAIKGNGSTFGHVKASDSSLIRPIGDSLEVGTDNNQYARADHVHTVTYSNIKNPPYIPSKTSDLTNDSGFLTEHQDISGKVNIAQGSSKANMNVVTNASGNITTEAKPFIPSKTSDLTNDSGYLTQHQDISGKEDKTNKTSSWNSTTNNTRYPTEKLVKDSLDTKENSSNKTSSWNSTTNNTRYPTEKLVKDSLDGKSDTDHTHPNATSSSNGLMSSDDKAKLDGISSGANAYTHPSYTARTGKPTGNQTPAFGGTATVSQITSDSTGHVTGATDRTIKIPNTLANGTTAGLSTNDYTTTEKTKLAGVATGATKNTVSNSLSDTSTTNALSAAKGADLQEQINNIVTGETATDHNHDNLYSVSLAKLDTPTSGYIATYEVTQGSTSLGKIDIPKDYLVKSGSVKSVTTANNPVSGYAVGDKYIDFVINTKDNSGTDEHIYINVKDLIDVYTHPNSGVTAGTNYNGNQTPAFGATFNIPKLTFNAQGHITASANSTVKIPNTLGNGTTAGLSTNDYTTTEKTKLAGIATGATKNTVENSLTSTSTTNALSAAQGKELKTAVDGKSTVSYTQTGTGTVEIGKINIDGTEIAIKQRDNNTTYTKAANTPPADTTNGTVGTVNKYALEDHSHPKSSLYAEASHQHTKSEITDFPTSMTPTSHTHGNITNAGAIGSTANLPVITTTSGKLTTGSFGTAANTFCQGNDSRLSNTRTPTDGTVTTAKIVDANVTTAKIADSAITSAKIADGTIANADIASNAAIAYSKLSGVAAASHTHDTLNVQIIVATSGDALSNHTEAGWYKITSASNLTDAPESVTYAYLENKNYYSNETFIQVFYTLVKNTVTNIYYRQKYNGGNFTAWNKLATSTDLNEKANTSHTHTKSQITDFPTSMTPTSHTHGNITNAGAIGSTANLPIITTTSGKLTTGSFGTAANTFCQGNDSRLSNARTPTAHATTSTTYGGGTASNYGHVKVSDNTSSSAGNASQSVAASSAAVKSVYDIANPLKKRYDGKYIAGAATVTKPYLRLFNIKAKAGDSSSSHIIFEIIGNNNDRLYAKIRIDMRQHDSTTNSSYTVTPLEVYGFNLNELYFGFRNAYPNTSLDIFRKVGAYVNFYIRYADDHTRDGTVTMYSPVVNSTESYTDLAEASTTLYNTSYTATSQGGTYNEVTNTIPYTNIFANKFIKRAGTNTQLLLANGDTKGTEDFATSGHTHTKSQITDFPTSMTPTSHNHGSLANGGTLNSDITSVNKIAVTDSSNNLKTISQLPYSKISGTPTIPSKTSQLTNDSGFLTSYTPPTGSTSQAGIVKLNTSTSSTSTTEAATPSAVKSAYDLANGKPSLGTTASTAAKGNHGHGNITTDGKLGSASDFVITDSSKNITTSNRIGNMNTDGKIMHTVAGVAVAQKNDILITDSNGIIDAIDKLGNITYEGKIGTAANKPIITGSNGVLQAGSFGTAANTFCQGNDSRLSDARTPTSHTHGNITNAGAIGSTANLPIITTTSGKLTTGAFESTATNIKMNGTQSVGSSNKFARADHVHPTDTSRAPADHTHDTWTEYSVGSYCKIYANSSIKMAYIRINSLSASLTANTDKVLLKANDYNTLTTHKPIEQTILPTQTPSILMCYIGIDGNVYARSTQTGSISITCTGTYPYQ